MTSDKYKRMCSVKFLQGRVKVRKPFIPVSYEILSEFTWDGSTAIPRQN